MQVNQILGQERCLTEVEGKQGENEDLFFSHKSENSHKQGACGYFHSCG